MTSAGQYSVDRMIAATSVASVWPTYRSDKSATGVDIALLVSALLLPRFALPFGNTSLQLDLVAIGLILTYLFISGKLLIQYDRLLWFLGFALASTCSLLLNFHSTMLTGYSQFVTFFLLLTLSRPSTADQYKRTLQAFQILVMLLSCLAVAHLVAEFLGEGDRLIKFYGILPDFLFGSAQVDRPSIELPSHFRSNGIFLTEASMLSQIAGLGILIEVLEFRRPRYLLVMMLGFLLSYSGTGSILLLVFLPLAGLRGRAGLPVLLICMFALGLFATGMIELSAFTSRVGEFEDTRASGFSRFVSPFWLAAKHFDTSSLQAVLLGSGPGSVKNFGDARDGGGQLGTWIKILYEYGIIGSLIFVCFLAACLRRSRCPGLVVAAIIFAYVFLQGMMTITIALCTLSGPEPRRRHIGGSSQYRPSTGLGIRGNVA